MVRRRAGRNWVSSLFLFTTSSSSNYVHSRIPRYPIFLLPVSFWLISRLLYSVLTWQPLDFPQIVFAIICFDQPGWFPLCIPFFIFFYFFYSFLPIHFLLVRRPPAHRQRQIPSLAALFLPHIFFSFSFFFGSFVLPVVPLCSPRICIRQWWVCIVDTRVVWFLSTCAFRWCAHSVGVRCCSPVYKLHTCYR